MEKLKVGYVAIIGSPNAGKSTLLNSLLDAKIAITSDKVNTTRNLIRGIYTDQKQQIIFVDTPGINTPQNKLQVYMKNQIDEALMSVDLIIYILDAKVGLRDKEEEIISRIAKKKVPKIVCINKIDLTTQENVEKIIDNLKARDIFDDIIAMSVTQKFNNQAVLESIYNFLQEGEKIYSDEQITDMGEKFYIAEIIREKVFRNTYAEIPHGVYVKVEEKIKEKKRVYIEAIIYVERESQKGIVIGNKAEMLKKIGTFARKDLEYYYNENVYLDLTVRVDKGWTNKRDFF